LKGRRGAVGGLQDEQDPGHASLRSSIGPASCHQVAFVADIGRWASRVAMRRSSELGVCRKQDQ